MTAEVIANLHALLRGQAHAVDALANALRVEAHGRTAFGRTDALDLFAARPVALSAEAQVLSCAAALAVLDTDAAGRTHGVFAELCGAVLQRVWLVGDVPAAASASWPSPVEPAVRVAGDDFMTQLRQPVHGDAADHPALAAAHWPQVEALGRQALAAVQDPPAASSSHAVVLRAFGEERRDGRDASAFAALYALRVQATDATTALRIDHRRWALAAGRIGPDGALLHHRLAVSDAWPVPAPVSF